MLYFSMELRALEKIGLTRNESIVYLTLLKIGTSKTGDLLVSSGLNSGKIYEILESLKDKGLVSESIINNIRHFDAAPTSEILSWLDKKKEEIEKDKESMKKQLLELESLRKSKRENLSKSVTYTGFNGFKTAVGEAFNHLKEGDEVLGMGITGKKDIKFNNFWITFGKERARKKIKAKNLFSDKDDFYKQYSKIRLTENKLIEGITPVTIDIFGENIVLILNYDEPSSFTLIYNKNTATSFKEFFYQLWKIAKK
jgi:sugar-specific transcriptional regulator TrmB